MANYTSKKDLVVGKRFKKIIENLFPGKSRQHIADAIGVLNEARIRLYENGSIPEPAVLGYLDRHGYSIEWLLLNKGEMKPGQDEVSEAAAANAPTPVSALPPGNAVRRKGDEDAAHRVLRLKTVGDAAALEKGSGLRGIFDDGALFWDAEEIPETTHLVRVRGDSMSPMLMHGQYAMVGPQYLVERGDVPGHREIVIAEVTVQENDIGGEDGQWEGVHCKRIQDGGDFWHFTSINPTGASFSVAKDNCRLWRVIGVYFAGKGKPPEDD